MKLVTEQGNGYYSYNGKLYESDIIRSCIRPKSKAVGKLVGKHIREKGEDFKINPDVYMRFLLEDPNPYMSGQVFQEKMTTQLELNNNAFAVIVRDGNGYPVQLYPITAYGVEAKYREGGDLYLRFNLKNGKILEYDYVNILHLRQDFNENDLFGDSPSAAILPLMDVVSTIDQGIIKATKNSTLIRWLMKFRNIMRPEDIKLNIQEFTETYLDVDSKYSGVVGSDTKYDLEQVKTDTGFVANPGHIKENMTRIYNFFNTNQAIVQSSWTEDQWNSYYESQVEPLARQMASEWTRKLFTRKERGFGNKIIFDASSLAYASMSTKLQLVQLVDRGAMTPNEWRNILNIGPIEGGNKPIRRLDTAVVEGGENSEEDTD
jgi:HK97 family phage portal protein